MKKCYSKEIAYEIPQIVCEDCNKYLKPGDNLCTIVIEWGSGKTTCEKCYRKYEIDWSLHNTEEEE